MQATNRPSNLHSTAVARMHRQPQSLHQWNCQKIPKHALRASDLPGRTKNWKELCPSNEWKLKENRYRYIKNKKCRIGRRSERPIRHLLFLIYLYLFSGFGNLQTQWAKTGQKKKVVSLPLIIYEIRVQIWAESAEFQACLRYCFVFDAVAALQHWILVFCNCFLLCFIMFATSSYDCLCEWMHALACFIILLLSSITISLLLYAPDS